MDKKIWLILSIVFCALTILFLILVIALPITKKKDAEKEAKEHSIPGLDNTALWAEFPGDLKTQTTHTFSILEYSDDLKSASVKDSIKLSEEIKYTNFEYSDQIKFDAVSTYKVATDKLKAKNAGIKTLSLGLFEVMETLSNPQDYQKGINSIAYLIKKGFQSPDIFIRHLFSYKLFQTLKKDDIKTKILKTVDPNKYEKILEGDSEYCLNKPVGFDHWVKLIGKDYEIDKADWLKELFDLSIEEIYDIYSINEYLYTNWIDFNAQLAKDFNCQDPKFCENEIIYNQLINGDVVKSVDSNIKSLLELYQKIDSKYYPFEISPELFSFYDKYKEKHSDAKEYKDYQLNMEQIEKLLGEKSDLSLLSSENSVFFLTKMMSNDFKAIADKYNISEIMPSFLCEYIYDFLPKLLLYPEFKNNDETLDITPMIKVYSKMASDVIKKTYYPFNKALKKNIFKELFSSMVFDDLKNNLVIKDMDYDSEDFCYIIMQQILDDGRKTLKICADPITSFRNKDDVVKWYEPYRCVIKNETGCDMSVIERLKSIVYITQNEIKSIYETNNFGKILEENYKALISACGDKCNDDEYLKKIQFWKSEITQKLPEGKKSYSLHDIVPDLVPYPMELPYFFNEKKITKEISEKAIDCLIALTPSYSDDIFDEDNYEAYKNMMQFEQNFALYMNGKSGDEMKDIVDLFDTLNNIFVFEDILSINYENIDGFLQGNDNEDKKYLEYLSNGDYYNNFKPGMKKTTGFNFGINFNTNNDNPIEYDKYAIDTNVLRKIVSINNSPYLNTKKLQYDHIKNDYIYIPEPISNHQSLTGDAAFIDGFEYNHEDDTIYYLDKLSFGTYKFTFSEEMEYQDEQTCRKYVLDTSDIAKNKDSISQKLNKPVYISVGKDGLATNVKTDISSDNYICVEPNSNMVLDSKINLVYSLNTKNYGYLYPKIENNKNYPIFLYSKEYEVNIDSFNEAFPSINSAKDFKKYFLAFGIIFLLIFAGACGFCFYKYLYHKRERVSISPEFPDTANLINDSRDPTLNSYDNKD